LECLCEPLAAAAGKPSESKKPYKKFGGNKSMAIMKTMFKAYVDAKKAGKSNVRSVTMTLEILLTVNRKLGIMTCV
jgi:hypothetical protein